MTFIPVLSDALLLVATVALALYCWGLARRLRAFNDVDSGLGSAITALSQQVDDLKTTLETATSESADVGASLDQATRSANDSIGRLEMLIAAAEDIAAPPPDESDAEAEAFIHFRARRDTPRDAV